MKREARRDVASDMDARPPLTGLRVLDLTRVLAGPTATQMLGDLGADVVKVERPERGDDARSYGPPFLPLADDERALSTYFAASNRNKRSLVIDLSSEQGRELVRKLAAKADVLVENYRAGDLERRGLGYAALAEHNPRLVYCSITGFGHTGPRAQEPGYDLVAQALSGVMQLTGPRDGEPYKAGIGIADLICGYHAVIAVLAALAARGRTGRGQHIDLALYDAQLAALSTVAADAFASGCDPERQGNGHPHIAPYGVYPAQDGHLVLTIGNDRQLARFARIAGAPELLAEPRFASNALRLQHRSEVDAQVSAALARRPVAEWCALLASEGVPCAPVRGVLAAFEDPQAHARGMRIELADPQLAGDALALVGNPLKLSATPVRYDRPPPRLGEHSDEVLREWLG